ncbi:hypothetical protein EVAR_40043_1 [Eumeta japonica]|uniref:Uncharacterized protein n=1 Tax=Eumeta variegata TaxID=151549 RepID=A0A4C1WBY7_EUMVA|nr:hypothetical protein EVAR_40043_1 [Eumeta japonica]
MKFFYCGSCFAGSGVGRVCLGRRGQRLAQCTSSPALCIFCKVCIYPFHANQAHPQEIVDSHIHQGARNVKTTNTTSLSGPLSCNGQRVTKTFLRQPQTTTDSHACQMSQTNHHQHYPNSYRQVSNNGDL